MAAMNDRDERSARRKEQREEKKARDEARSDKQTDGRFRAAMPTADIVSADDLERESCLESHSDHATEEDYRKQEAKSESASDAAANRILRKLNPKPPANGRQHAKRSALDQSTLVGGCKRRGRKVRKGKKVGALDGPASRGLRFPEKAETSEQRRELKKIAVGYLRRLTVKQFGAFTDETLSKVLGLGDRQIRNIRSEVRKPGRYPEDLELTLEVLQGMQSGRIAGVLGTDHTEETRALFSIISNTGRRTVEMNADHVRSFDMLKAAFDIDYRIWTKEVKPWPFKKDGSSRQKSSKNGTRQTA
jgi:hypothetical protein